MGLARRLLATLALSTAVIAGPAVMAGPAVAGTKPAVAPVPLASSAPAALDPGATLLAWARDPDVRQVTDAEDLGRFWPDGAAGANREWERGKRAHWYVDDQTLGARLLLRAAVTGDLRSMKDGAQVLDWALRRQQPDGGFSCGDPEHSTAVLVGALAQAGLALQRSSLASEAAPDLARYRTAVDRAARWLVAPARYPADLVYVGPYGDRLFALGAALALAGACTGDADLGREASQVLRRALATVDEAGVVGERGGFDSGFQAIALQHAALAATVLPAGPERDALVAAIRRGLAWEATRLTPDGGVLVDGNTRTDGQERTHLGRPRRVNPDSVALAFLYGALLTGDESDRAIARKIHARAASGPVDDRPAYHLGP